MFYRKIAQLSTATLSSYFILAFLFQFSDSALQFYHQCFIIFLLQSVFLAPLNNDFYLTMVFLSRCIYQSKNKKRVQAFLYESTPLCGSLIICKKINGYFLQVIELHSWECLISSDNQFAFEILPYITLTKCNCYSKIQIAEHINWETTLALLGFCFPK